MEARLAALLEQLCHPEDVLVRIQAVQELKRYGAGAAGPVTELLLDRSQKWWVRSLVADILGVIGGLEAVPALLKVLEDKRPWDEHVRLCAVEALGKLGAMSAVSALATCLSDTTMPWDLFSSHRICDIAAVSLQKIGTPEALEALAGWRRTNLAQLTEPHPERRLDAAIALGLLGEPAALESLEAACAYYGPSPKPYEYDYERVFHALEALKQIMTREVLPKLLQMLPRSPGEVCGVIAHMLGQIGDRSVIPVLMELLSHEAPRARMSAAWALGKLVETSAQERLLALLEDPEVGVRQTAEIALARMPEPAIPVSEEIRELLKLAYPES
jgi:HEAT repeat protein